MYGRKKNVKRPYKKGKSKKRYIFVKKMHKVPVGMPNTFLTKMRYYSEFALDPGIRPSIAVKEFRTSLYDPDISVGGQQPTPFDQMTAFYKKFRVLGVKAHMRCINAIDPDTTVAAVYGMIIQPAAGLTAALTFQDIMQSERVTHNYKFNRDNANKQSHGTVTIKYSGKKYYGKSFMTDEDYNCTAAADASRYAVISCFATSTDPSGAGNPSALYYSCWMEYIVLCSEPNINPSS